MRLLGRTLSNKDSGFFMQGSERKLLGVLREGDRGKSVCRTCYGVLEQEQRKLLALFSAVEQRAFYVYQDDVDVGN